MKNVAAGALIFAVALGASACSRDEQTLRLATTTSTENSGLLAVLLPPFERAAGVKVHVIAVGTGKALRLGANGDVDVVLVHAPAAEARFVADGHGVDRRRVMHNDFVVVGPATDPAGLEAAQTAADAFRRLAEGKAAFVSRGDDSGTHKKEMGVWESVSIEPSGRWYVSTGQGMGAVLRIADEKQAYALADRGTWLAHKARLGLAVVFEGDPVLHNPYGVIAVNPEQHPGARYGLAKRLIDYLTSPEAQRLIADYKVDGEQLFVPDAEERP